ncbi:acyltransferase family protein [Salana multivorans]
MSVAQDAAYYDTLARLWEYLAGTLVAVALARWSTPRVLAVPAGLLGLGLLLATGPLIDGRGTFPGVTALVPIAGAALVILAGQHGMRGINRVLAWRPVAVSGTYAYEFYLWHWVVLVLALAALDVDRLGRWTGLAVLVGSAVLAWGTHAVTARLRDPATPEAPADPAVPAASTGDAGDAAGFSPDLPRHATRLRGGTAASPRRGSSRGRRSRRRRGPRGHRSSRRVARRALAGTGRCRRLPRGGRPPGGLRAAGPGTVAGAVRHRPRPERARRGGRLAPRRPGGLRLGRSARRHGARLRAR